MMVVHAVEISNPIENDDVPGIIFDEEINHRSIAYKFESRQRKALLFVGLSIAFGTGLNLFALSSSNEQIAQKLGASVSGIQAIALVSFLMEAMFGFGFNLFIREFGLKMALLTVTMLQLLGSLSMYVGLVQISPNKRLAMIITGQLSDAVAFGVVIESITIVAVLWRRDARILVSSALFAAFYLGSAFKSMLAGIAGDMKAEILENIQISRACIAVSVALVVSISVKKRSKETFSGQVFQERHGAWLEQFSNGTRVFYRDFNLLKLQNAYSIYFAIANSGALILRNVIILEFPNATTTAHWIQAAAALTGGIGILCGAVLRNLRNKEKMLAGCSILISASLMAVFTFAATSMKSVPLSSMFVIFWAAAGFGWLAIGVKYILSLSHATSSCVAPTFCIVGGCFYTVIITPFANWILGAFGFSFVGYFFSALYGVCLLLLTLSKDCKPASRYQRL